MQYAVPDCLLSVPEAVDVRKEGDRFLLSYQPEQLHTADLLEMLQKAGPIRELTVQPRNIDRLIAEMYREMAL